MAAPLSVALAPRVDAAMGSELMRDSAVPRTGEDIGVNVETPRPTEMRSALFGASMLGRGAGPPLASDSDCRGRLDWREEPSFLSRDPAEDSCCSWESPLPSTTRKPCKRWGKREVRWGEGEGTE